jgi:hypothetical protein
MRIMTLGKLLICFVAMVGCSVGALAQSAEDGPCLNSKTADGGSNAGIRQCFTDLQHSKTKEVDALVARQVKSISDWADHVKGSDLSAGAQSSAKDFHLAAQSLKRSQTRWKIYREGYCRSVEFNWTIGSGAPGAYQKCMYELAVQRKKELLRDFGDPAEAN